MYLRDGTLGRRLGPNRKPAILQGKATDSYVPQFLRFQLAGQLIEPIDVNTRPESEAVRLHLESRCWRRVSRAPCSLPGGATSSRPLEGRFLAALSDQSPMTVGVPLVGALRSRIAPPAESPLHVAIPGARKDAGPSRRVKHAAPGDYPQKSPLHPPGPVVPRQWPADGGAVRGRATTRVAPTGRSTAATRCACLTDNPGPVSRGIRRGTFLSPPSVFFFETSNAGHPAGAASSSAPTGIGVLPGASWSGVVLGADWDRRPSGRRLEGRVSRAPCSLPGGATSSRPLEGRFLAALSDQFPMTVVGGLLPRIPISSCWAPHILAEGRFPNRPTGRAISSRPVFV